MAKRMTRLGGRSEAPDGRAAIARALERTRQDLAEKKAARNVRNAQLIAAGKKTKEFKADLSFAIYFAKYIGEEIATALEPHFPGVRSGENPSQSVRGPKRVDLSYSTPEMGLGLAVSFKSVHFGEEEGGKADFVHNMKRNDEELRVEATAHHLRQPYAVMAAILFLPFEASEDFETSSFASWVEYLWPLKGRDEPEDAPDRFELVFIGLYARDGSDLGFYELGGPAKCPRNGRPRELLTLADLVHRLRVTYDRRNARDFFFEGEEPER